MKIKNNMASRGMGDRKAPGGVGKGERNQRRGGNKKTGSYWMVKKGKV